MAAECPAQRSHAGSIHNIRAACDGGDGHAPAERFRHGDQVRLHAEVFAGKPFAGTRKTRLHFVSDEENPMLAANLLQEHEVILRRNDEPAFAKDRLRDDRGHRLRRYAALERVLEMMRKCFRRRTFLGAIRISERNAIHIAGERLKARFVGMGLAGERHGQQCAAMESVLEANYRRALGISPRDLDRVLHRFRAGIEDDRFLGSLSGGKRVQFFRQRDIAFVRSHREAEVQVLLELFPQCRHHARRAVADVETTNPAGKIEIAIAVHILERRAFRGRHENGRAVVRPAGHRRFPPGHQGPRARSGNFRANLNRRHFSTTRLEFRRGSQTLAWFRDILPSPRVRVRGRSRTACTRPTALRRTSASCYSPKRCRREGTFPREKPCRYRGSRPPPPDRTAYRWQYESRPLLRRTESRTPPVRKFLPEQCVRCFRRRRKLSAPGNSLCRTALAGRPQSRPWLLSFLPPD